MKNFKKIAISNNLVLFIQLENERFSDIYQSIETELADSNYQGNILVDLLPSNGLKRRFAQLEFENKYLNLDSFSYVQPDLDITGICSNFYLENTQIIKNSSLTKPQKFLFLKGRLN